MSPLSLQIAIKGGNHPQAGAGGGRKADLDAGFPEGADALQEVLQGIRILGEGEAEQGPSFYREL